MRVIPGRGCVCGVVGCVREKAAIFLLVCACVSGSGVGTPAVEGESPVRESMCALVVHVPE